MLQDQLWSFRSTSTSKIFSCKKLSMGEDPFWKDKVPTYCGGGVGFETR